LRIVGGEETPKFVDGSGRKELAEALVSTQNPLTARVMINRVWQNHFGRGLVRTPSNFGKQGERPTHPELLDWLADEFMRPARDGDDDNSPVAWSLKRMHRLILLSATYQMGSESNPRGLEKDGDNRLLWRMNPRRMEVEAWRDSLLAVTGELDRKLGGESSDGVYANNRRTLYASVSRNADKFQSDSFLRLFDFPVPRATSEGRTSSVVPQQALFLMNNDFMAERARAFAKKLTTSAQDDAERIELAYQLLYARTVTAAERRLGLQFLQSPIETDDAKKLSAWQQYCQVLLGANEFMYVE
jgi:hypothetical protein